MHDIPPVSKFHKLLLGEIYDRNLFDKNGLLLYLANYKMSSSSNQLGSMVLHRELDLFYGTPIVCGFSKCRGLKENPRHVTLSHYFNDRLPKVDSLIPLTTIKNPLGDIEKTCRNTSICSLFDKLQVQSSKFYPKLTNSFLLLSQHRVVASQSMIPILPKTSLLGDPKSCMI